MTQKILKESPTNRFKTFYSQLKNSGLPMIYYHSIPEGHQCPGNFQEIGNIIQKKENVALIYFGPMLKK